MDSIIAEARKAFSENAQKDRPNRYKITFKNGWVRVGTPFSVPSQLDEFVIWVDYGGIEVFRLDQVHSFELLPHPE